MRIRTGPGLPRPGLRGTRSGLVRPAGPPRPAPACRSADRPAGLLTTRACGALRVSRCGPQRAGQERGRCGLDPKQRACGRGGVSTSCLKCSALSHTRCAPLLGGTMPGGAVLHGTVLQSGGGWVLHVRGIRVASCCAGTAKYLMQVRVPHPHQLLLISLACLARDSLRHAQRHERGVR